MYMYSKKYSKSPVHGHDPKFFFLHRYKKVPISWASFVLNQSSELSGQRTLTREKKKKSKQYKHI